MDKVYTYRVRVFDINYYVSVEDIDEEYEMSDEEIKIRIKQIKSQIEQDFILEIETTEEDLEDDIAEAIAEETGWLVEDFSYEILSKEKYDE